MADLSGIIEKKEEAAQYMEQEITYICKNLPKREPGSEGEKQACEYMAETLKKDCGCDKVYIDSFEVRPRSFFGWIFFTISFVIAAMACFFFIPILSAIFVVIGLFTVAMQLGFYKKFIDWAFPKKTGHTVYGSKKPTGEIKRRILFNGHPDAVWEWRVNNRLGGVAFEAHGVTCILGAVYYFVLSVLYMIKYGLKPALPVLSDPIVIAAFAGFAFLPFLIGLYFMVNYKQVVDGANDNLSGCYMGIALLKYLQDNNITFENTEIGVVNTGSEEAGIRGSRAFAKKHKEELSDVPTVIYSYDTIHDPGQLMVNYRDLNGLRRMDKEMCDLFYESAKELDLPCKKGWVPPFGGSTDTVGFMEYGIRSAGITGLNHKLESYYHTRKDSYDNLDREGLANCFAITAKVLEHFDEGKLDQSL